MDYLDRFGQTSGTQMTPEQYMAEDPSKLFNFTATPKVSAAPGAAEAATGGAAEGGLAAGAATANPWVMGGMAAMGALSAGLERKRKEREMQYQSIVDKLRAQSDAVGNAQQFASRISY